MEATTVVLSTNQSEADVIAFRTATVMRSITFTIGALGLAGNSFVVLVILSGTKMRKQLTNAYIINQSVIDATVSFLLIMTTLFEDDGRKYETYAGELYCKFWLTKIWLWSFFLSSTYNLLALTMERYLAVVHPIWHKTKLSKTKVTCSIVLIWLFGPSFNLAYMLPTSGVTEDRHCSTLTFWPDGIWHNFYGVMTIVIQFVGPLFLLIFFYARMIMVLRRGTGSDGRSGSNRPTRVVDTMENARKNILKTLAIVACCFVLCWVWNQIYFLMFNFGSSLIDFTSIYYNFTVVMVFLNCCVNPFIYISKYDQFRQAMKALFCKNKVGIDTGQSQNIST